MWELRYAGISDDGDLLVTCPELDDEQFRLVLDDDVRAALLPTLLDSGAPARPPLPDGELTPREIQARIRCGDSAEDLARAAGVPVERIRRFEGPVLRERQHIAELAQEATLPRRLPDDPTVPLGALVADRLQQLGAEPESKRWDAWRRDENSWLVRLEYKAAGHGHLAQWTFEPAGRVLRCYGLAAESLCGLTRAIDQPAPAPALHAVPRASIPEHESDGSEDAGSRRATVPSWEDIMFGVRRPEL
jgi:hypothetical protein